MSSNPAAFVADFVEKNPINTEVTVELNYIVAGVSMFSFAITAAILFAYSKGDHTFLGVPITTGILFFSALVTMQAVLSNSPGNFNNIYCLVVNLLIGILLNMYGSMTFFKVSTENERHLPFKQSSISVIMLGITIPLCLLELFVVIMSAKHNEGYQAAAVFAALIQKVMQVGIYHFSVRHKGPDENRHHGASFFLKIMALFNFFMWVQSISDSNFSMKEYLQSVLHDGASIVSAVYTALVIDYRLLCALLYIEFALEIDRLKENMGEKENVPNALPTQPIWNTMNFRVLASQYTGFGYLLGISIFIAQFTVALQYIKTDAVGPWVNIFGILADIFVICQGLLLIRLAEYTEDENSWCEAGSKGVHIMVALMGIVGLVYWSLKSSLTIIFATRMSSYHDSTFQYLAWISLHNVIKVVGVLFQLYFFVCITPSISLRDSIRRQRICYMLMPCIMLAQISVFINTVVDSYSYVVEKLVHEAKLNTVMSVAYKVGEPLHLGFCLHMFFHFFIVNSNLRAPHETHGNVIANVDTDDEDSETSLVEQLLHPGMKYRTI